MFTATLNSQAAEKGKQLFILSGQSNMARFEHEQYFIPAIHAEFGEENSIIVKEAEGGQPISKWYKDWKSSKGETAKGTGKIYDALIAKVKEKTKGVDISTITFIWMQGEADSKAKTADVYEVSFKGVITQLENDLGRKDINIIIGRLSDYGLKKSNPEWKMIREIQMQFADSSPRARWVDTDDLNGKRNSIHYNSDGYKKLGERYVATAIELIHSN